MELTTTTGPTLTIHSSGLNLIDFNKNIVLPEIEKVIFQKAHTIVVWKDKSRTVVKCFDEQFDKEKGLAMAIAKKYMDRNKFKKLIENADIQDK